MISQPLISISKLTADHPKLSICFSKNSVAFIDDGATILTANSTNGLYYLDQPTANHTNWHSRLGHISDTSLRKLDLPTDSKFCEPCAMGKQSRTPIPTVTRNSPRSSRRGQLLHSDIAGPFSVRSLGGAQYWASFIDDYSRFAYLIPLKNKSDLYSAFITVLTTMKTFGLSPDQIHSDNGSEYTSSTFKGICSNWLIKQSFSTPYTPEQNGIAERFNRTLIEKVRPMLIASNAPPTLWAEAAHTAVYLYNRTVHSLTSLSPYVLYHNHQPKLSHLRSFGCTAYVSVPGYRSKLEPKSTRAILLGYSDIDGTYRLQNERKKVFYSRNVSFDENTPFYSPKKATILEPAPQTEFAIKFDDSDPLPPMILPPVPPAPVAAVDIIAPAVAPVAAVGNNEEPAAEEIIPPLEELIHQALGSDSEELIDSDSDEILGILEDSSSEPEEEVHNEKRITSAPYHLKDFCSNLVTTPTNYSEASSNSQWIAAMNEELLSLKSRNTY